MSTNREGMAEGIKADLETSGYALELRVTRAFAGNGASHVEPSFTYTDLDSNLLREGDVRSTFYWPGRNNVPCTITAVTECKSSTDKPWVAMLDYRHLHSPGSLEDWALYAHGPFVAITEPLNKLWAGRFPFIDARVATHAVTPFTGTDKNRTNAANDAVRQVLSAAVAEVERYKHDSQSPLTQRGVVILPVIVTAAPLFTCELNTENDLDVVPVNDFIVRGSVKGARSERVYVMNEGQLPRFSAALAKLAKLAEQEAYGKS